MLSTRKIKRKIRSINNIKKITRAMEMVSAAKLRKVQGRLYVVRPYVNKLQQIVHNLIISLSAHELKHPFLAVSEPVHNPNGRAQDEINPAGPVTFSRKPVMVAVIAADKGLCGGYNTSLIKTAIQFIERPDWSTIKIIALGRKIADYFKEHPVGKTELVNTHTRLPVDIDIKHIKDIMGPMIRAYLNKTIDEGWLVYTEFINSMVYKPRVIRLLPLGVEHRSASTATVPTSLSGRLPYGYIFEPQPEIILELLLPKYLELLFYRLILESLASEQSARMIAMRNATENADEVIEQLILSFNKARQASITKELLDIVGGVEAMHG